MRKFKEVIRYAQPPRVRVNDHESKYHNEEGYIIYSAVDEKFAVVIDLPNPGAPIIFISPEKVVPVVK